MSILNRRRYDAPWLYRQAQLIDEWADTPPGEGTSVRAGLDIMRTIGLRRVRAGKSSGTLPGDGIAANRWATSMQDWLDVLGRPDAVEVPFANSWGRSYPRHVWIPVTVVERLMREDGEFPVITDR